MRARAPGGYAWVIVAALGCSVPDLDTAVTIECTNDRGCPTGHACRLGRCCASRLEPSQCPIVPPGTAGAPCTGATCAITEGTGVPVQGTCFTQSPRGYCFAACSAASPRCGDYAKCVAARDGTTGRCVRRCHFAPGTLAPCRNGPTDGNAPAGSYVCVKDLDDPSATAGLCLPDCAQSPSVCAVGEICDTPQHRCVVAQPCQQDPFVCMSQGLVCDPFSNRCGPCTVNSALCLAYGRTCNAVTQRCQ